VINRLRAILYLVPVNLARFINKCGIFETIKNMHLRATFDGSWIATLPEIATASAHGPWVWLQGGGLIPNPAN
jgi:hypothetical protein